MNQPRFLSTFQSWGSFFFFFHLVWFFFLLLLDLRKQRISPEWISDESRRDPSKLRQRLESRRWRDPGRMPQEATRNGPRRRQKCLWLTGRIFKQVTRAILDIRQDPRSESPQIPSSPSRADDARLDWILAERTLWTKQCQHIRINPCRAFQDSISHRMSPTREREKTTKQLIYMRKKTDAYETLVKVMDVAEGQLDVEDGVTGDLGVAGGRRVRVHLDASAWIDPLGRVGAPGHAADAPAGIRALQQPFRKHGRKRNGSGHQERERRWRHQRSDPHRHQHHAYRDLCNQTQPMTQMTQVSINGMNLIRQVRGLVNEPQLPSWTSD